MKTRPNLSFPKETWIFFLICAIGFFLIFTLWLKPARISGAIINANVTINPTDKDMELIKQADNPQAIKTEENGEYYLYVYGIYINGEKTIGKYILTKKQYDGIDSSEIYWFDIKYKKKNDFTQGTIKNVYDYNPAG